MQALTFFFAFVAVLALIGLAAWLVRRFAGNRLGTNTNRGRMPRLAVIDAAAVDGRRRLVLVRRDNIEHLLMIGGPTDIVVEPNIVRAMPGRDQIPSRSPAGAEPQARISPLPDAGNWGDDGRTDTFELPEPQMPEPPPRPSRPAFADEVRRPVAPAISERRNDRIDRSDPLAGFAPEPIGSRQEARQEARMESSRMEPRPEPRPEPPPSRGVMPSRSEPMLPRPTRQSEAPKPPPIRTPERAVAPPPPPAPPPIPAPAPAPAMSSADQNLAEMAQRLEAALRRPAGDSEPRIGAPPVAPEPPAGRSAARSVEPSPPQVAAPAGKSGFENLEDEMASLLGRPKSPS
jgi:flagellar protein FliO/FliZ